MASNPSSGLGMSMNPAASLPQPIPPPMPLLPPTTTSPYIPPPTLSSPLPPISTISKPASTTPPITTNQSNEGGGEANSQEKGTGLGTTTSLPLTINNPEENREVGLPSEGSENVESFQPRLVLRVKTKRSTENMDSVTFEKQDISKNDSYCWVCHEGGEVLCCDKCPRVFHLQCSGLDTPPEDDDEWVCPVCKNISRKPKRSRPSGLKDLLLLAVERMMFQGTEIFQKSVPDDIIEHYREYIFYPMHLGMIKEKVMRNEFQSTREFLHETEWILHNCIIYNGGKHALTKIAKGIVKVCKEDMREIELCPSCYSLTVKQPFDWFCIPCNPPHRVVLAKVRGYPLWPAKLISETSDKCDVRFFGQHDRSLVPRSSIQDLNGPPPTPTTKTTHWTIAMDELTKYRQNINQMVQQMSSGKSAEKFINEKIEEAPKMPPRIRDMSSFPPIPKKEKSTAKPPGGRSQNPPPLPPVSTSNFNGFKEDNEPRKTDHSAFPVSNHIPCSPQIVMVNPSFSESEDSTIHGNSASFPHSNDTSGSRSNPSSPGSDIGLRIDLETTEMEQKRGEKCLAPNNYQKLIKKKKARNTLSDVYYDSSLGTATSSTMDVRVITPTAYRQPSNRPGEVLSLITDNLAEKLKDRGPSSTAITTSGGGDEDEAMMMEHAEHVFSSVYPRDKLAIAVVDPNAKRQQKRKKKAENSPLKRSKRVMNKAADNATPPPPSYYDSQTSLITGTDMCAFETNGFVGCCSGSQVYPEAIEEVPPLQVGEGLVADTIRTVDNSFGARLDGLIGRRDDMGYQYFSEKMMSSIKTVINEMLSMFESKGKMGAKQIKDQLHTAWPVPDSRSQMELLKKELQNEMRRSLDLVRTNAEVERDKIVQEVRRQVEAEKERAILETKKKKWCSYCFKEAQYNCCWNANYCNEACQQAHWPEHSSVCMQLHNQGAAGGGVPPRGLPISGDGQKLVSPANTDGSTTAFTFPNSAEQTGMSDEVDGVSVENSASNQPLYQEEMQTESVPIPNKIQEQQEQATAILVPEEEKFVVNEMEYHQSIVPIERHPNQAVALMVQSSSPVISQSLPPHHVIPLSSSPATLPLPTQPISPTTPPQVTDHPGSVLHVGNTFSWPYQQPMAGMSHDFSQSLPLLPQVPALTPTTQSNTFFRVF